MPAREGVSKTWREEWTEEIEDVTERARAMKDVLDREDKISTEESVRRGLMPVERVYEVGEQLRRVLHIGGGGT